MHLSLNSLNLLCHQSRTLQFGQIVNAITYASCPDRRCCPILATLTHLGANSLGDEAPLFNYLSAGKDTFYSHSAFMARLRSDVKQCRLDMCATSCHSLRRGRATLSFACGLSNEHIKMRGGWVSNCYQHYIMLPHSAGLKVAKALVRVVAAQPGMFIVSFLLFQKRCHAIIVQLGLISHVIITSLIHLQISKYLNFWGKVC